MISYLSAHEKFNKGEIFRKNKEEKMKIVMKVAGLMLMLLGSPIYAGTKETAKGLMHPELGILIRSSEYDQIGPIGLSAKVWLSSIGVQIVYEAYKNENIWTQNIYGNKSMEESKCVAVRLLKQITHSENAIVFAGMGLINENKSYKSEYNSGDGPGMGSLAVRNYEGEAKRKKIECLVGTQYYLTRRLSFSGEINMKISYSTKQENNYFASPEKQISSAVGLHVCF